MTTTLDSMRATCDTCGYAGTLRALTLHSCDIQARGGRCEDFPCCGHTDGDGCQTLPSHTMDFYLANPHLLGDDMDDAYDDDDTCGCGHPDCGSC